MLDCAIITATWKRPALLASCIQAVASQCTDHSYRHVVVSDGPDPVARRICERFETEYHELPAHIGDYGKSCLDFGIAISESRYLVFWDDDNVYPALALNGLMDAAIGYDLGVVQIDYYNRPENRFYVIPRSWTGHFCSGDIDTANVCVRREFLERTGLRPSKVAPGRYDADFVLWQRLAEFGPRIHFEPVVALTHI